MLTSPQIWRFGGLRARPRPFHNRCAPQGQGHFVSPGAVFSKGGENEVEKHITSIKHLIFLLKNANQPSNIPLHDLVHRHQFNDPIMFAVDSPTHRRTVELTYRCIGPSRNFSILSRL